MLLPLILIMFFIIEFCFKSVSLILFWHVLSTGAHTVNRAHRGTQIAVHCSCLGIIGIIGIIALAKLYQRHPTFLIKNLNPHPNRFVIANHIDFSFSFGISDTKAFTKTDRNNKYLTSYTSPCNQRMRFLKKRVSLRLLRQIYVLISDLNKYEPMASHSYS